MSPDLIFILTLALRMAVTAAFVVSASMIAERFGRGDRRAGGDVADFGRALLRVSRHRSQCGVRRGRRASEPADQRRDDLSWPDLCRAGAASQCASQLGRRSHVWIALAALSRTTHWSVAGGVAVNIAAFAVCIPLLSRFRHVRMPLITRRWYDVPLRATLVATLVATVTTLSGWVGPGISGVIALFPVVFSSMMLILHPRIGGPADGGGYRQWRLGPARIWRGHCRDPCRGSALRLGGGPEPGADDLRDLESRVVVA